MKIIFVIGAPCCGKSKYISDNLKDFEVVDLWEFQKKYKFFDVDKILESYNNCEVALIKNIKENRDVILEHTLLRAIRRKVYIDAIRDVTDNPIDIILINPDNERLLKRCECRKIPIAEVNNNLAILELPEMDEGYNSIKIVGNGKHVNLKYNYDVFGVYTDNTYILRVPELHNCFCAGGTLSEALQNLNLKMIECIEQNKNSIIPSEKTGEIIIDIKRGD